MAGVSASVRLCTESGSAAAPRFSPVAVSSSDMDRSSRTLSHRTRRTSPRKPFCCLYLCPSRLASDVLAAQPDLQPSPGKSYGSNRTRPPLRVASLAKVAGVCLVRGLTLALGIGPPRRSSAGEHSAAASLAGPGAGAARFSTTGRSTSRLSTSSQLCKLSRLLRYWREQNRSFSAIASIRNNSLTLTGAGEPQQLPAKTVSADFFRVGGRASLGTRVLARRRKLILRPGLALAVIGLGIRACASLMLTRFIAGLLYEVGPFDPLTCSR